MRSLGLTFVTVCFALAVCGGCAGGSGTRGLGGAGSSGGSTDALTVAERVSVVDASEDEASSLQSAFLKTINGLKYAVDALPGDSDYNTDRTFTFVEERSMDAFDMVNEILCMLDQTAYDEMIGLGDYKAQIDVAQCEKEGDDPSAAGEASSNESSGSGMPEYEYWIVNSYRDSDDSPHVVALWITMGGGEGGGGEGEFEPEMSIVAEMVITEARSDSNPYGIFQMNFLGTESSHGEELISGYLRTFENSDGAIEVQFYETESFDFGPDGGFEAVRQASLNRAFDGSSGSGSIFFDESSPFGDHSESFDIAFNEQYFLRGDASGEQVCLDRANFDTTTHRYNLYQDENAADPGKRVTRNSGFPIKFVDGENTYHGHAGYWGLWLPDEAGIENGDTVLKQDFQIDGPPTETPYTVFISPGKLQRNTKKSLSLAEVAGVPLNWHRCNESACVQYRAEWDKDSETLFLTGIMNEETHIWEDIAPEVVTFTAGDFSFGFWSESLGGSGHVNLTDPDTGNQIALENETAVIFHVTEYVLPGDDNFPTSLACFHECLDPSLLETGSPFIPQSSFDAGEGSFENLAQDVAPGALVSGTHYALYSFDSENMMLTYGGDAVATTAENESYPWGFWGGNLIKPSDLVKLACPWNASNTCPWQSWELLDEYYSWETGPNQWNQLSLLEDPDTGDFLSFEAPLFVEYTHSSGTKYYLNYGGPGDLWGIPGKCVNMDTGADVDCGDWSEDTPIRWVSEFSVPDGSSVVDAATDITYYVKGIDREQRMKSVDASQCSSTGLDLSTHDLPDEGDFVEPDIGDEPEVDDAPAVIAGEVQD